MDIVPGVGKILEMCDHRIANPPSFKITTSSPDDLYSLNVLTALLAHAPRQSNVALDIWKALSPCLHGLVYGTGNPDSCNTLKLIFTSSNLDAMHQQAVDSLTEEINKVAYNWVAMLILPIRASGKTPFSQSDRPSALPLQSFRKGLFERDKYRCPISYMVDYSSPHKIKGDRIVVLQATRIIPFPINSKETTIQYIEKFTGQRVTRDQVSTNINDLSNGILLDSSLHDGFGRLWWGIETKQDQDGKTWNYYMKTFNDFAFYDGKTSQLIDSSDVWGNKIIFNRETGHPLPDPALCDLHLAVCRVAHACGAAEALEKLFFHDPDVIGPVAGSYTLPAAPDSEDFVLHCFERRLFEESLVGPVA